MICEALYSECVASRSIERDGFPERISVKNDIVGLQPSRFVCEAFESALLCTFIGPAARFDPTVFRIDSPEWTTSMRKLSGTLQESHARIFVDIRQITAARAGDHARKYR